MEVLPTLQFWRDGAKLWEHRGVVELDQDLAEGARPGRTCLLICLVPPHDLQVLDWVLGIAQQGNCYPTSRLCSHAELASHVISTCLLICLVPAHDLQVLDWVVGIAQQGNCHPTSGLRSHAELANHVISMS